MTYSTYCDVFILQTKWFRVFLWDPIDPALWDFFIGTTKTGYWVCIGPVDFNIYPRSN